MASLANQTISSTYDGLVKTATDQPVGVSGVQLLEDGVGNSLALSVGRANQGVTVTGPLTGTLSATSVLADGVIATTQATSDNSTKVATTAFVKSVVTAEDLDIAGDSGTGAVDLDSQVLIIAGTANEIETSASGQTITIGLPSTITANVTGNVSGNLTGTVLTAAQTNITSVGTLSSLAVSGNLTVDTDTLFVDAANNRVGIGTTTIPANTQLAVLGNFKSGFYRNVTTGARGYFLNIGANSPSGLIDAVSLLGAVEASDTEGYLAIQTLGSGTLTERARVVSTGLSFPNGNGIDFSASAGGGATSSLLDDYEEGTWTMGISFGGAAVGVTYVFNTGNYTKIGRQVTVTGFLRLSNKGSSTGAAKLTGLPFSVGTGTEFQSAASLRSELITFADFIQLNTDTGTTTAPFTETTNGGTLTNLTNDDFANNSEFLLSLTYFV